MNGAGSLPLNVGLTIINGPYASDATTVHVLILRALLEGSSELPIPMPKDLNVYDVLSGSPRQVEGQQIALETMGISRKSDERLSIKSFESATYMDWTHFCSIRSVSAQMSRNQGCAIVLQQPPNVELDADGLWRLSKKATVTKNRLILLAPYSKEATAFRHPPADELLHVTPCDPDPGYEQGLVVSCPELISGWGAGGGKVMCSVSTKSGAFKVKYSDFVSVTLKVRLMSALRSRKWTMERIGQATGQDKSTASRALKDVPQLDASGWNKDRLAKWFAACDLDPDLIAEVEKAVDEEVGADPDLGKQDEADHEEESVADSARNTRNTRNTRNKVVKKRR